MREYTHVCVVFLMIVMLLPENSVFAQKTLPQVPITYPGDTSDSIIRRAKWIDEAKKEGRLTFWGTLIPNAGMKVLAEFNKIYPFIKTDYWRGTGEEIASKLEAEFIVNRSPVDVAHGGETVNFPRWRSMGVMAPFIDILPEIKTLDRRLYGEHGDWARPGHTVITPQYNRSLVSAAEAPKSWDDLLDPKWRGHIGITADVKAWTTLALAEGGWGIEKTEDFLVRLSRQKLIWGAGHTEAHTMMIAGEFKILAEGYIYHVLRSQEKKAPVDWARANPVVVLGPCVTLPKKAPHPSAARLFLEWLFSPQGLRFWEEASGGMGAAFPGLGTKQSKALEGIAFTVETEEVTTQRIKMGLTERFSKALGVPQ